MRASIPQKKRQTEAKGRIEEAATKAENVARKGGLSPEAVGEIKAKILGVAG